MKTKLIAIALILVMTSYASAQEYLEPKCVSIIQNDQANILKVDDIDGDGVPNILVGTSINGNLHNYVYKGADCTTDWSYIKDGWIFDTLGDVKSFYITDLSGDGRKQIVLNSIASTKTGSKTPTEYVHVITNNGVEDWNFNKECGLTHSIYAEDIDGTGVKNVIMGTMSKKVCALKDSVKQANPVLWTYIADNPVQYVKSADIDGDGSIETVAYAGKYLIADMFALDKNGQLKWTANIADGLYNAALPEKIIAVDDIDGDGKYETIVGTYKKGAIAYDSMGTLKWSYETQGPVSSVITSDLNGDGKKEILIGAAPNLFALDTTGRLLWKWTQDTEETIYSMSAADIDGDNKKEVAVGTTGYIQVIKDGKLLGGWKYAVEIQGSDRNYSQRDAHAVSVYMGDLDNDGEAEIVGAWNWEEDTIMGNLYTATLRVYEINKNYRPTTTTRPTVTGPTTTLVNGDETTSITSPKPRTTTTLDDGEDKEKKGGICCLPMLPAIIAITFAFAANIPLAATKKQKRN